MSNVSTAGSTGSSMGSMGPAQSNADSPPQELRQDGRYTLVNLPCLGGSYNSEVFLYNDTCAQDTAKKMAAVKLVLRRSFAKAGKEVNDQPDLLDPNLYAERTASEVLTMWQMRHAHTVKIRELILTPDSQRFALAVVMEHLPGGDLLEELRDKRFSEPKARWIFQQLILTVDYLHSQGTAHRNIKLANILLDRHTKPLITLCDFGFSKDVTSSSHTEPAMDVYGGKGSNDQEADILACGLVLYTMVTGSQVLGGDHPDATATQEDWRWAYPDGVELTQDCRDLIDGMLTWDPEKRASLEDIKNSQWFKADIPAGFDDYNNRARQLQEKSYTKPEIEAKVQASIKRMVNHALVNDNPTS